jgi:endonuclease G
MNSQGSNSSLKSFAKSIDNIESLTGIDFFNGLSDDIENKLKSTINISS